MIDPADKQTQALPLDEQPAKRKRGRPTTGAAMTAAEKQRAYRERMKSKSERWVRMFWADIVRLRVEQESLLRMVCYGRCNGAIYALYEAEVISLEVYQHLDNLIHSAMLHSGNPFVDSKNAGPVISGFGFLDQANGRWAEPEICSTGFH